MAKSLRELSKQRQKFKEIKGKDKRGRKKYQDRLERGEGEKSSVEKKETNEIPIYSKICTKGACTYECIPLFSTALTGWLS